MKIRTTMITMTAVLGIMALGAASVAHASWLVDLRVAYEFDDDVAALGTVTATAGTVNQSGTLRDNAHVASGALQLDGGISGNDGAFGDQMNLGSNELSGGGYLTVATWIKVHALDMDAQNGYFTITRIHNGGFNWVYIPAWGDQWTMEMNGVLKADGPPTPTESVGGDWVHLAHTYNRGTVKEAWVNGVMTNSATAPDNEVAQAASVILGSSHANAYFLNGQLDDWAVWARVLEDGEIEALAGLDRGGYDGRTTPTGTVIPEPGTIALLGLSGLVMLIRRRFVK